MSQNTIQSTFIYHQDILPPQYSWPLSVSVCIWFKTCILYTGKYLPQFYFCPYHWANSRKGKIFF